ncbi:B12-binding domain-containing radical SAM protein [Sporanaerobacter acetigenes]|uniref:Radical SAM superfamily enzyme YgiQ, UPF0313 family n=1 Tax=Sporanaerobacter acetigenes DSM 13106 TaxID=1123281 RepID=A0A1M5Z8T9_9FIRM|nr:radical SAM protein [Sporanaerobacter acetigenes]SHI20647.1 Radical SAM superfamily enzyme YgiQ, UPF0313 family [Sporanaerobacter acetigenes DSM 13106]
MKTIFISPDGDVSDSRYMRIPLGVLYIAAVLEQDGHEIKIICSDLFKYTDDEVKKIIEAEKPDIVGITCVTCNYRNGAKYAKIVKKIDEDITVLIGGVHTSFTYEKTLREYPDIDFVSIGEGEITSKELWAELEKNKGKKLSKSDYSHIKGLAFINQNGQVIKTPAREYIKDLDSIPYPARHLVPVTEYQKRNVEAHLFASRGCAFNCKFCLLPKTEGNFRKRSPQKVVDEIEYLMNTYNYKLFKFVDNSFSTNKQCIIELCNEIKNRNINIMWRCQTRVDLLNEDIIKLMIEAGCKEILVGVESASDRVLNEIYGKHITLETVKNVFRMGRKLGLVITPSFVIGYPNETPEELEATKQLIIELYKDNYRHPRMCFLTPFPGTEIADDVFYGELNSFLEITDWDKYTHICPTIRTKYMSRHELAKIYVEALAEITAGSKERMERIWPEEESVDKYYTPQINMYLMKEGIIRKNKMRMKKLIGETNE